MGERKTLINEGVDFMRRDGAIEHSRDPMLFVHMVSREESCILSQGPDEFWWAFDVDDIDHILVTQPEFDFRDGHDQAIPFWVVIVPEYGVVWIFSPRIIRLGSILCCHIVEDLGFIDHEVLSKERLNTD